VAWTGRPEAHPDTFGGEDGAAALPGTCSENGIRTNRTLQQRLAIRFSIAGDLRFIAHSDTLRLFGRALARAGVAVRYSEGFNPKPRVWLPLPRPVGIAGREELLIVELAEPLAPGAVVGRLAAQLPEGIVLGEAQALPGAVLPRPLRVGYRLEVPAEYRDGVCAAVRQVQEGEGPMVVRRSSGKGRVRSLDIRRYLAAICYQEPVLEFSLRMELEGGAKPGEVLQAVGLPAEMLADVRRHGTLWEPSLAEAAAPL
jgi:radical SAM-linked protein